VLFLRGHAPQESLNSGLNLSEGFNKGAVTLILRFSWPGANIASKIVKKKISREKP
jgi:hypothetical protein